MNLWIFDGLKFLFSLALWERARVRALLIVHGTLTSILSHEERKNNQRRKPMRRRIISVVLATILLATIFPAEAQQQAKIPKIGFLAAGSVLSRRRRDASYSGESSVNSAMLRART